MVMKNFRPEDMPNGKSNPRETVTPDPIVSENPIKGSDVHESEKQSPPAKKTTNKSKSTASKSNVSEETAEKKADTTSDGQEN